MDNQKTDVSKDIIPIVIDFKVNDDGVMTPFASHMVIQIVENIFKLSFFELKPPIQLDASQAPPSSIKADRVASVFVQPDKMPAIIKILQQQLDKYNSSKTPISKP